MLLRADTSEPFILHSARYWVAAMPHRIARYERLYRLRAAFRNNRNAICSRITSLMHRCLPRLHCVEIQGMRFAVTLSCLVDWRRNGICLDHCTSFVHKYRPRQTTIAVAKGEPSDRRYNRKWVRDIPQRINLAETLLRNAALVDDTVAVTIAKRWLWSGSLAHAIETTFPGLRKAWRMATAKTILTRHLEAA